jgi:hypothetical protein
MQYAVYQTSLDRLVAFVVGNNGHLYDKYWNGQQWVWEDQGRPLGTLLSPLPSAVYQTALDRLVAFVVGNNGHLYDKYWNGQQWVWEDQGTAPGTIMNPSPSAVYQTALDRLVAFVFGNDGHLYDKYWNGQQWVWEDQGIPPGTSIYWAGSPSAVYQTALDRLVVFVIGSDGHLYDKYWNGQQWVWEDQGTPPGTSIISGMAPSAVYQTALDRLVAFVVGNNGHLYDKYWNGHQWVWEDQGTPPGTSIISGMAPSAVYQTALDRLVVFVIGSDGHLYDKYWNGQQWVWEDQGTPPGTSVGLAPSAVYQTALDRLVVFVIGSDLHLYDKYWNGQQWVWEDQGIPPGSTDF